jgi:hypothetical protein
MSAGIESRLRHLESLSEELSLRSVNSDVTETEAIESNKPAAHFAQRSYCPSLCRPGPRAQAKGRSAYRRQSRARGAAKSPKRSSFPSKLITLD